MALLAKGALPLGVLRVQQARGGGAAAAAALCLRRGCLPAVVVLVEGDRNAIVCPNGRQCPRARVVLSLACVRSVAHLLGLHQTTKASTAALQKCPMLPLEKAVLGRERQGQHCI